MAFTFDLDNEVGRWAEENEKYSKAIYTTPAAGQKRSSKTWVAPPADWVKINTNATLTEEGWVGVGVVARDNLGKVVFSACKRWKAWWQMDVAEAKAIILALKLGSSFGCRKIIIESDSQEVTSRLSKGASHLTDLDAVLVDALKLSTSFEQVCWSHVRREGSEVAHHLARFIPFNVEQIWSKALIRSLNFRICALLVPKLSPPTLS
ncbi:uncharacterized protein LOC110734003 [Chenopodium quinoa]|uniref:uncharacterized protein LOC110734003 n=1 Tax=Chenopodium quinoa TaxID=63459 RepID=UPI000B792FC9|nr:uncharacterized protein LOC110734003 [Chenopodium quinoa]